MKKVNEEKEREPLDILLLDDDQDQIDYLEIILGNVKDIPLNVYKTTSVEKALKILHEKPIQVLLVDYLMPVMNGFEVLKKVKEDFSGIEVVVVTGNSDTKAAVEAMKHGAYDYILKPVKGETLESLFLRLSEKIRLTEENRVLKTQLNGKGKDEEIITVNAGMKAVLDRIGKSAGTDVSVLILGESGTGKELVARSIHRQSLRKSKPFITVNISALPESLIESELFGHKKGSFTGAVHDYPGRFRRADKGTLFIDEVGDIPLTVQVKLLRAIQFGQIEPVGGTEPMHVDTRIIAATSRDLGQMIKDQSFRQDFYYRLNVVTLEVPPLRDRKEDIPILVEHFLPKFSREHHKVVTDISGDAMRQLIQYDFPGNVRELENIIQRAVVLCEGTKILPEDLPITIPREEGGAAAELKGYKGKMAAFEKHLIEEALRAGGDNKSEAARILGIGERRLRYRMEKLGVDS